MAAGAELHFGRCEKGGDEACDVPRGLPEGNRLPRVIAGGVEISTLGRDQRALREESRQEGRRVQIGRNLLR